MKPFPLNQHSAPAPVANPLSRAASEWPPGLLQLLPVSFDPASGCYAEAGGIALLARCVGAGPSSGLEVEVRLLPLRLAADPGQADEMVEAEVVDQLLRELASGDVQRRACACQALGQFPTPAVAVALLRVASEDPDAFVQQVARTALAGLETSPVARAALAGVQLCLDCRGADAIEGVVLGPVATNEHNTAVFRGVPAGTHCCLRLAAVPWPSDSVVPSLARLLSQIEFGDTHPHRRRDGGCLVEVYPQEIGAEHHFGALIRFSPPLPAETGDSLPAWAIARGAECWAPTFVEPTIGLAWFYRLPRGHYVGRVAFDAAASARSRPGSPLLALDGNTRQAALAGGVNKGAQIHHPSDPRLLALIERGGRGEVVLTVQTEAAALQAARVRYALGSERGELALTPHGGRPLWRGSRHLEQRWRGDEAVRLKLGVAVGTG